MKTASGHATGQPAPAAATRTGNLTPRRPSRLSAFLPVLVWGRRYRRDYLAGDLVAGVIVAVMLIPQGMAYALLAGLPPQVGLYAGMLPLAVYGLLGTSRTLAVGPVAIVSLLTASGIGLLAAEGRGDAVQLALTLALLVGLIQAVMGVLRSGFLVNFLSHPVLVGFSAAAAIVIGFSQVKNLLGIAAPPAEGFVTQVRDVAVRLGQTNPVTLALGLGSVALLLYGKGRLEGQLVRRGVPPGVAGPLTRSMPLVAVLLGTLLVRGLGLHDSAGVAIVGAVPAGLPSLTWPSADFTIWRALLPTALAISFVGYMESISVAKSLASRRRENVDANQELIALGAANLAAAFTGGYPVTGGFSRSLVNDSAGARTGLASLITAALIALSVLLLTPLFFYIPKAVLAAVIVVAVSGLVDTATMRRVWRYSKQDAAALLVTFAAVLLVGIESGILTGAAASLILFIWRTSNPHVAVVGRLGQSETYRNVLRHPVQTWPHVALVRIDASLYFANTRLLQETVLTLVADNAQLEHLVLIGTAVNEIDFSALETLEALAAALRAAGVTLHLAAIKGPVLDRLQACGFVDQLGADRVHLTTHAAMQAIGCVA